MKVILICEGCGKPATKVLDHYDEANTTIKYGTINGHIKPVKGSFTTKDIIPNTAYGNDLIPEGVAFKASIIWKLFDPLKMFERHYDTTFDHQYWLNLNDIKDHVVNNDNWKNAYGCCGVIATANRPNRQCSCGTDIGYEFSECYSEHVFVPNEKTTRWDEA